MASLCTVLPRSHRPPSDQLLGLRTPIFKPQDQMGTHFVAMRSIPGKTFPLPFNNMHVHQNIQRHFLLRGSNLHPGARWDLKGNTDITPPSGSAGKPGQSPLRLLWATLVSTLRKTPDPSLPSRGITPVVQYESTKTQWSAQQGLQPTRGEVTVRGHQIRPTSEVPATKGRS